MMSYQETAVKQFKIMAKSGGWEWVMWSLRQGKKQSHQLSKELREKKQQMFP